MKWLDRFYSNDGHPLARSENDLFSKRQHFKRDVVRLGLFLTALFGGLWLLGKLTF